MTYRDSKRIKCDSDEYDCLLPLTSSVKKISEGIVLREFSYYYQDALGNNQVNVYALEIPINSNLAFGMEFSREGSYCIDLVNSANNKNQDKIIGALNCNFGLIVDEFDRYPVDLSYNLHIEGGKLIQVPVVDKPAITIDKKGQVEIMFLKAIGKVKIGSLTIDWVGSLSKKYNYFYSRERAIVYNSYNRGLLLVKDPITVTKKFFDPNYSTTKKDRRKIDLVVNEKEGKFIVTAVNKNCETHYFEGNFIVRIPLKFSEHVKVGDKVEILSIDTINPKDFSYGSTGSPLLVPDVIEARKNILSDRSVQTRAIDSKRAYKKSGKFCRSCIVKTKNKIVFFLADARKGKEGQEGFSIYMLRYALAEFYPNFESAINVDGGNAPKLIVKNGKDFDVLGNLQYKNWPTRDNQKFSWSGFLGRKVPAIIYVYKTK